MTRRTAKRSSMPEPDGPAIRRPEHVRDRVLSPAAGAPKGYRRRYSLDEMRERRQISEDQYQAAVRLQTDFAISQREGGAGGASERIDRSTGYDISQSAIDAGRRYMDAMAVLPAELVTMTVRFLFPTDGPDHALTLAEVGMSLSMPTEAVSLGIRTALSLLARHYARGRST